ncbi:MAG TPA: DMT family transporter [Casimicrobiaceae bacterium]|nr:DMT family transporter [Casimicrobiaceae bacterium]
MHRAILLFLLAGLCLSSLDATAKYLVRDHDLFLVVWARYAGQMLVVTPFAWQRGGPGFWRTQRLGMQLLRSAFLLVATFCFFGGLRYLPLAEASAIIFLTPVLVVVLSGPLLGERPDRTRWIAVITGFVGIMILVRPGSAIFHPAALLLVVAAVCNALFFVITRKLVDENAYATLFYSALVGTVGLSLALPWEVGDSTAGWREALMLVLLGLLAGLGHWFVIGAYRLAPASLLTPLAYLQIIWATSYGYLIFGQLPDRWSALGMAIVVGSGLWLALQERRPSSGRGPR